MEEVKIVHDGTDQPGHKAFGCPDCKKPEPFEVKGNVYMEPVEKALEAAVDAFAKGNDHISALFAEQDEVIAALRTEAEELRKENQALQLDKVGMKELRSGLFDARTERDALRTEVEKLKTDLEQKASENSTLSDYVIDLCNQLEAIQKEKNK